MVKIALDAGHGLYTAGKRTPDDEREWSFNSKVLLAAAERLNAYDNVQILRLDDPTGKTDVPLRERTNKANAWGADVLISIHHNALAGRWHSGGGVETYTQTTSQKASKEIAAAIHQRTVKAMGLRDRGLKTANFHMTRESKMPSVLSEGGFMDSTVDIVAMRNESKLKAQGVAIAEGLAAHFKLKLKSGKSPVKPNPTPPAAKPNEKPASKPSTASGSVVDYMNSKKMDSSFKNRAKLAKQYGIANYSGTASQNSQLLAKLKGAAVPNKPAPVAPSNTRALRLGDSGEEVRKMQQDLAKAYFYPEKGAKNNGVDGYFGAKTLDALKRFQSVHTPSQVDGYYGAKTKAALMKVINKK